jgi:hypothetical protein|tara:strand:+ start:2483 stop:2962 length:480 start_codon:yes stop_codon:yes gene_type:complete
MNAASRNQARAVMKSIGSRPNGSMAPYHPTLGKAFSAQPNRLGDIVNEFYTDGTTAPMVPDEGGSMFYPPPHPNDKYNTIDYSNITKADLGLGFLPAFESINTPALIGLGLVFVGAGFPGYKFVVRQAKKVIDKPEKYIRNTAMVSGLAVLVAFGQATG